MSVIKDYEADEKKKLLKHQKAFLSQPQPEAERGARAAEGGVQQAEG